MNRSKRIAIFKRFQSNNPHPTTELNYQTPFELLIAVILSAQATDLSVNKATTILYKIANTPESINNLGLEKLKYYIKRIGLFNSKAKHIVETCQLLIKNFNSTVPHTREALESLPGVGRKTANVILNTIFKQSTMAVDTHIFRVSNRIGLALGTTVLKVEHELIHLIPAEYLLNAHHWLILHGRYVCKARKPCCIHCSIQDLCEYKEKHLI